MNDTDDFVKLLEESYSYKFSVADTVKGIVVKKDKNGWLVDIGAKSEAFLSEREIGATDEVKLGEIKEFYIVREETDKEETTDFVKEPEEGQICHMLPLLTHSVVEEYRNKCTFTIGLNESNEPCVGFRMGSFIEGNVCIGEPQFISFLLLHS